MRGAETRETKPSKKGVCVDDVETDEKHLALQVVESVLAVALQMAMKYLAVVEMG